MKKVVIFYSYTNNTRFIAEQISNKCKCDMYEIKAKEDYSEDYQKVVSSEEKLVPLDYQPEIRDLDVDFNLYDEIILCTPVWWYSVASPVNTFLHTYNLKGKTIIPVVTNGGFIGRALENIEKLSEGNIVNPISLKFENNRLTNPYDFEDWMNNLEISE